MLANIAIMSFHFTTHRGRPIRFRAIARDDSAGLIAFYHRLSSESWRRRFFSASGELSNRLIVREVETLTDGARDQYVLLALDGDDGVEGERQPPIVGVGRSVRDPRRPTTAEAALVVRDDYQGEGIGWELTQRLLGSVRASGVTHVRATALSGNASVERLIGRLGLPTERQHWQDEVTYTFTIGDPAP